MLKFSAAKFTLYPLLWLAICFAAGILAASFLSFDWKIFLSVSVLSAIFSVVFINRKIVLPFIFTAFVALGGLHFEIENQMPADHRLKRLYDEQQIKSGDPIEVEGILENEPELAVGGFFLTFQTEKAIYKNTETTISGRIRLFAPARNAQNKAEYDLLDLRYGSRVRVACRLRREDALMNAGIASQTKLLDQMGIDATGMVKSPLLIEKIEDTEIFAPLAWIYRRRQSLITDFSENFNRSTAGIMIASLLGNEHFLDKPTAEVFRTGGTFHILVISGLHITFIGGLTLFLIRFFTNKRLWQFLIASAFLWSYSLAVGAEVPVVRATIMFTILLFSQVLYRRGTLLNALGLCALILLVWRPNDIFTPSFQLTFISVGAIVATAFPLLEKLRAIGDWSPSAETPFPPAVSVRLKRFCEMLYWREDAWKREVSSHLWATNLFKSPYLKWLEIRNRQNIARYFFEAIVVSVVAQAWLLPLLVVYFHRLSLISILLNIWVGVIIALESFAAIFAVFLVNVSETLALPLIKLTEMLNWLLVSIPSFFTENAWASFRVPHYSGSLKIIYILYFIPPILLTLALNRWNPFALRTKSQSVIPIILSPLLLRCAAFGFLMFFALVVFHPLSAPAPDGRLHLDFLDVGQGDAALITFPNGETMLVDGGGKISVNQMSFENESDEPEIFEPDTQSVGERVVSNYLWEKGYSKIDYIAATHADADHLQGLADVAKNFAVRTAIFSRTPMKNAQFAKIHSILQQREIESLTISRGDVLMFGKVKVEVLYPEKDAGAEAISDNNHSMVLRITFGDISFLLTGDIERETEERLLNSPEHLQTDVIKVAHHGSRTSSIQNFVNASKAKLAVISVGKDSPYGHPHEEVVERWKVMDAKVLTTGENGTISVSTDGRDLQLKTYNKTKIMR